MTFSSKRLNNYAKQTGLNTNTTKTRVMCINTTDPTLSTTNGVPLDFAEYFTHLGSLISKERKR